MKALSVPIAMIMILTLLVVVLIPAFIIFNSRGAYSSQGSIQGSVYQQQQEQQNNQIFNQNPRIHYDANPSNPVINFSYISAPTPLNITQIYYFSYKYANWTPLLNKPIVIDGNVSYPLPSYVASSPIIIVTSLGNVYLVNPNSSVGNVEINSKNPVYVLAYVMNGSKLLPVHIFVVLSSTRAIIGAKLTPVTYYLPFGTYVIDDMNGTNIYLSNYGLTARFLNWSIAGYGTLSYPNNLIAQFTAYGPLIITAIYNVTPEKFNVTIKPYGLPLGQTLTVNGSTIEAVNKTVPVIIDSKVYNVPSSGITLTLTYGYHVVQFPKQFNITFNYSYNGYSVPYGQKNTYNLTSFGSNTSKISIVGSNLIFVNGSGMVYANYTYHQTYYLVEVENDFYFPSGVTVTYNSSPVIGNVAAPAQLLQINNTYFWGPVKNYQPEEFYVPANSIYNVTLDLLHFSPTGNYTINGQNYIGLLSIPMNVTIENSTGTYVIQFNGSNYPATSSIFWVDSPTIIINYQEWEYAGKLA